MFGKTKLAQFKAAELPQEAQSAWDGSAVDELIGAEYKPVLYVGNQTVHGTNYIFYAEQKLLDFKNDRRLVRVVINGDSEYKVVSIEPLEP